jgi:outer membrane protein assembly factor BamD
MIKRLRTAYFASALIAIVVVTGACNKNPLVLPADSAGEELFQQAQGFMDDENWGRASEAYDTLLRNYPTSPHLPQARLSLGRAYYEQGRGASQIMAVDAFRNFLTYHPSHGQVDYAQLMIAMSYMKMMRSSDRDQSQAVEALQNFEIFFEDYPDSLYAEDARANMLEVIDNLAGHELIVADFQMDRGRYAAARNRALYALRKYPSTTHACEFRWILGESHRRQGDRQQATIYFQELLDQHPDCDRVEDARDRMSRGGATRPSDEDVTG